MISLTLTRIPFIEGLAKDCFKFFCIVKMKIYSKPTKITFCLFKHGCKILGCYQKDNSDHLITYQNIIDPRIWKLVNFKKFILSRNFSTPLKKYFFPFLLREKRVRVDSVFTSLCANKFFSASLLFLLSLLFFLILRLRLQKCDAPKLCLTFWIPLYLTCFSLSKKYVSDQWMNQIMYLLNVDFTKLIETESCLNLNLLLVIFVWNSCIYTFVGGMINFHFYIFWPTSSSYSDWNKKNILMFLHRLFLY
jgi:hypothetical protein